MVKALLVAPRRSSPGMAIEKVVNFVVLPRIGELVDIDGDGQSLTIRVTEVVHIPDYDGRFKDDGDGIHVWGEVSEHGYQY